MDDYSENSSEIMSPEEINKLVDSYEPPVKTTCYGVETSNVHYYKAPEFKLSF